MELNNLLQALQGEIETRSSSTSSSPAAPPPPPPEPSSTSRSSTSAAPPPPPPGPSAPRAPPATSATSSFASQMAGKKSQLTPVSAKPAQSTNRKSDQGALGFGMSKEQMARFEALRKGGNAKSHFKRFKDQMDMALRYTEGRFPLNLNVIVDWDSLLDASGDKPSDLLDYIACYQPFCSSIVNAWVDVLKDHSDDLSKIKSMLKEIRIIYDPSLPEGAKGAVIELDKDSGIETVRWNITYFGWQLGNDSMAEKYEELIGIESIEVEQPVTKQPGRSELEGLKDNLTIKVSWFYTLKGTRHHEYNHTEITAIGQENGAKVVWMNSKGMKDVDATMKALGFKSKDYYDGASVSTYQTKTFLYFLKN